ncbi:family 78 glycoside hydrolase catalytic domain [Actinoplanes sp. TBRC 11911]|uniref:alpha-L-rhamnosidase n=1 Tax=Actinoplanes sp. TBRC 11911 TaxID=2729386 RepID=UPI00145F5485|nr:alpha-L-rhamnosidase [Actinoplanes sp. TBRC 11911]NMO56837.1 family 78 glycoside hydrolase catalytic domain [Actinoplanes sp. TBRC 11911]
MHASFVSHPAPAGRARPVLFRKEFTAEAGLTGARLRATARGLYQVFLNGRPVDDHLFKPGWTAYQDRLLFQETDVLALLRPGRNTITVSLAGGWYTEDFGHLDNLGHSYGDQPQFALELVLDDTDGSTRVIATDESWETTEDGPLTASGIYDGETYDARREQPTTWIPVRRERNPFPAASGAEVPPVRVIEARAVEQILTSPSGATIVDFGQNLVGFVRLTVDGPAGQRIRIRHAEVLENGELGTRPLRRAKATDTYLLAGDGPRTLQPSFTFHGFRYAQIDGWPGELDPAAITAVVVHSDMRPTGTFATSNALVNRLHENVRWSMRGNFLALPTDCPQRDERLGWTGDIQVFAPTAAFLYDCRAFLASWLRDLTAEQQRRGGTVPTVVPDPISDVTTPVAGWGDAATIVPWTLYQRYGDLQILRDQYASMTAWADVIADHSTGGLWKNGFQFGDWLDPAAPPDDPGRPMTATDLVATAYAYRSTHIVADTAQLLGKEADHAKYTYRANQIRTAYRAEFVTGAYRLVSDTVTAYAMTIAFGLAPGDQARQAMGDRLATLVRRSGYHISAGFLGTPLICDALTDTGHAEIAGRLLLHTEQPSWLYPVTVGATTIWERWDSLLRDGTINPGEMTSFNHYALGAVADWLHRRIAGLAPGEPGYHVIDVDPLFLPEFDWAQASLDTRYGTASVRWDRAGETVQLAVNVPPGSTARVRGQEVGSGRHEWAIHAPLRTAERPALDGLQTPLDVLIDDPEAYETVLGVLEAHDPAAADAFASSNAWVRERDLTSVLFLLAEQVRAEVETAVNQLQEARDQQA